MQTTNNELQGVQEVFDFRFALAMAIVDGFANANDYDDKTGGILCINSDTDDPRPTISLDKPGNVFYRVFCIADKM